MESVFERLWRLGPAALVVKAIVAAIVRGCAAAGVYLASQDVPETVFREARRARL